jgi:nicotinate-nucleotide adenylyltransferase
LTTRLRGLKLDETATGSGLFPWRIRYTLNRSITPSLIQKARHIGLLGGTFDPIHHAHLIIAEEVRATLGLSEMVFIPSGQPPHKPGRHIASTEQRMTMLELAIASNPHFSSSRIELDRPGPSYLVDTLQLLRTQWGNEVGLAFVVGWDSLEELHTWYNPEGILASLDHLIAVRRPKHVIPEGFHEQLERRLPGITERLQVVAVPQLDISSTDLRQRIAQGRPITYQTPLMVEHYILEQKLYHVEPEYVHKEQKTEHDTTHTF